MNLTLNFREGVKFTDSTGNNKDAERMARINISAFISQKIKCNEIIIEEFHCFQISVKNILNRLKPQVDEIIGL